MDEIMAKDAGRPGFHRTAPSRRDREAGTDTPVNSPRPTGSGRPREGDWLNGQLRRLYDDVLNEPVPDDLLDLVARLEKSADSGDGADGTGEDAGDRS